MTARGTAADPFEILLVEDNPADVDLVLEALRESELPSHHVTVASDGEEAMAVLRREGKFAGAPAPDIVLLDLNLPRKDGREVLAEMRADPALTHLPVLVLTSSEAERDLLHVYRLHGNCFISKPVDLTQFFQVIHAVESFWLKVARLPPRPRDSRLGA